LLASNKPETLENRSATRDTTQWLITTEGKYSPFNYILCLALLLLLLLVLLFEDESFDESFFGARFRADNPKDEKAKVSVA